jgi:hypothetical protein
MPADPQPPSGGAPAAAGRPSPHRGAQIDPRPPKVCIYPGCERPAVPAHPMGGPQPAFCDREDHNALSAHQERQRLAAAAAAAETDKREEQ